MDDLQLNEQQNELSVPPAGNTPKEISQKTRKFLMVSIGVVVIAVLCIVAAVVNTNKPINRFKSALKHGEYEVAEALYKQNTSDSIFSQNAQDILRKLLADTEKKFAAGKISNDEAHDTLTGVSRYSEVSDEFDKTTEQIEVLEDSKESYKKAEENAENGEYLDAIKKYEAVIEDDAENYSSAQKKKESAIESLCSSAVQEANNSLAQGDAIAAYKVLYAVGDYKDSKVTELLSNVTEEAQTQVIDEVQKLFAKEDYKDSYLSLVAQPSELKNAKIKELEENAFNSLVAQADTKAANGDYDGALTLLTQEDGNALSEECKPEIQKLQTASRTARLRKLKSNIKVDFDKFYKIYMILPNKAGDTILPLVSVTLPDTSLTGVSDSVSFTMYFSFTNRDWVYMNSIIIDCDGVQFNLSVDSNNRNTAVYWGSIYEGTNYVHTPDSTENGTNRHADLKPIIEAIESADTVAIRFSGKGGYKDVILSENEKADVKNMWAIYQILHEDDSLISVLE